MPGAARPLDPETGASYYPDATWAQLRLSSKSHWDVQIETPTGTVHLLASHPTPPVSDGPEDRNGARNAGEIRLWREYISPGAKPWLCDDARRRGGLDPDARFVHAGRPHNHPTDRARRHRPAVEPTRRRRLPTARRTATARATPARSGCGASTSRPATSRGCATTPAAVADSIPTRAS